MKCEHCGERIREINYALGPVWMHQPESASGMDGVYKFCKTTAAEPKYETPFTLKAMVLVFDPMKWSDVQPHIRPVLDAINSLPEFVRGEAFTMTLDDSRIDNNEVKLILEFETRNDGNTERSDSDNTKGCHIV